MHCKRLLCRGCNYIPLVLSVACGVAVCVWCGVYCYQFSNVCSLFSLCAALGEKIMQGSAAAAPVQDPLTVSAAVVRSLRAAPCAVPVLRSSPYGAGAAALRSFTELLGRLSGCGCAYTPPRGLNAEK